MGQHNNNQNCIKNIKSYTTIILVLLLCTYDKIYEKGAKGYSAISTLRGIKYWQLQSIIIIVLSHILIQKKTNFESL